MDEISRNLYPQHGSWRCHSWSGYGHLRKSRLSAHQLWYNHGKPNLCVLCFSGAWQGAWQMGPLCRNPVWLQVGIEPIGRMPRCGVIVRQNSYLPPLAEFMHGMKENPFYDSWIPQQGQGCRKGWERRACGDTTEAFLWRALVPCSKPHFQGAAWKTSEICNMFL